MIQEIITYIILGAAIALAISKIIKKMGRKKSPEKKVDFQNDHISLQHNCSDCSAECMIRNASKPISKKNKDLCEKIEIQKKL